MSTLRDAAAEYRDAGLSVFAVSGKAPLTKWAEYSRRLPTQRELASMPWNRATGIALALGAVSGGLVARDFDDAEAYGRFSSEHPWLAAQCPTVHTARGYHVYFLAGKKTKTINCPDGELRGSRAYVLLPPSRHPCGIEYSWVAELLKKMPDSIVFSQKKGSQKGSRYSYSRS